MNKQKFGFTLIEMLIVVTIIGILAALILPRLTGNTQDAKKKAHSAQRQQINSQLQLAIFDGAVITTNIAGADLSVYSAALKPYFDPNNFPAKCNQNDAWKIAAPDGNSIDMHTTHE